MEAGAPTLLVIEDTRDHALLVGHAARRAHPGLEVHHAEDGLLGMSYLAGLAPYEDRERYRVPDLVILDLFMPEMDGFEVLEWVRDRPEPLHVPIVVLTGLLTPTIERRCRDLGAIAAYRKPDDLVGLGEVVREIVDRWIGHGVIIGAHLWAMG